MNKEEILARSRQEHKNQDLYEKEVLSLGNKAAVIVAAVLATVFFVIQIVLGEGVNYALYAIIFAILMSGFWVKYVKLRRKHELVVAICYTILTLLLSIAHIYGLISASTIL